jgi:hypothetical protein
MAADPRTTGLLDDFVRGVPPGPNVEDPLSFGGRWKHLYMSNPTHWIKLESNGTIGSVDIKEISGGSGQAVIWYQPFGGNVECWGTTIGVADLREGLRMYLHISGLTDADGFPVSNYGSRAWTGYVLESLVGVIGSGTTLGKTHPDGIEGGLISLADFPGTTFDFAGGGIHVLRTIGERVQWWWATGADPTNFSLMADVVDTTYRSGYIGIGTQQDDDSPGWLNFGGGVVRRTQYYRLTRGQRRRQPI